MNNYCYKSMFLEELGVKSWINARNWSSTVGGNTIDERVLNVMAEVAHTFVDMHELFEKADRRVAELTSAEEAHITTGAGAAIELAVASCMAGDKIGQWNRLPQCDDMKNEVLLHRGHYINYTPQWKASGSKVIEYGISGHLGPCKDELESLIGEKTCCLAYTFSYNNVPRGQVPFWEIVELGRKYEIPVVVDAASHLPPVSNLYKYLDDGADIVCFSGGKAIRGPNNTGLMLGRGLGADLIKYVRSYTYPHFGWGRGHKISKEQIAGLVKALEIFIQEGDDSYEKLLEVSQYFQNELRDIAGLSVEIIPNDGQHYEHTEMPRVPRVILQWNKNELGISAADLDHYLAISDPPIFLRNKHYYNYYENLEWRLIDPFFLRSPEKSIILERLQSFFSK